VVVVVGRLGWSVTRASAMKEKTIVFYFDFFSEILIFFKLADSRDLLLVPPQHQ
jgi:hypothetical protein